MPSPSNSVSSQNNKARYLDTDKKVDIKSHLDKVKKEEASGLKNIEVRNTAKQLGKDDFLKLLITQLSHQDPTNPVKDQDFIAQMAQFSSLEQMKNISSGLQKIEMKQNYNLVGKFISGPDFVNGEAITGIVAAIFIDGDGKSFARVNGRTVDIDQITLVSDPALLEKNGFNTNQPIDPIENASPKKSNETISPPVDKSSKTKGY